MKCFCEPAGFLRQVRHTVLNSRNLIVGLIFIALLPVSGLAAALTVTSYSMPNGGTGAYVYQDTTYSNCPASDCTTTGALLSGGKGRLTNGVIPTTDWNIGSNSAGWIGWDSGETNGFDPAVTFNLAGSSTINSVSIWYDNSLGLGGVTEPSSVIIDGTRYAFTPDSVEGPQNFTVSGLDLTGSSANLQFFQGTEEWIMIGQVTFNGTAGGGPSTTPEPTTIFLMGGGLLAALLAFRGRRSLS